MRNLQPSRDLQYVFTYVLKMADEAEGDTPPPLPSSPIPSAETLEDLQQDESQSSSKNFFALQKMLSSSRTMYTQPGPPPTQHDRSATGPVHTNSGDVDPPTKRHHASIDEELSAGESPKLTHRTRDRPRRKTRVPSKGMLKAMKSQSNGVFHASVINNGSAESESADAIGFPPDLPPPPPESAPPMLPSDPPPSFVPADDSIAFDLPSEAEGAEMVGSNSKGSIGTVDTTGNIQEGDRGDSKPVLPTLTTMAPSLVQTSTKNLSDKKQEPPQNTKVASAGMSDAASSSPSSSGVVRSQAVVIGSFSERLRKIREKRTLGHFAASSLSPSEHPPTSGRLFHTNTTSSKPSIASPITSPSLTSPLLTSSPLTPSLQADQPSDTDYSKALHSTLTTSVSSATPGKTTSLDFSLAGFSAISKSSGKQTVLESLHMLPDEDKDSSPLESGEENSPPPLPPSPPPESPPISRPSPAASPPPAVTHSQSTSQRKKEEWKKKHQELDTLMSEPLPLLINTSEMSKRLTQTKTAAMEATIPEHRNVTSTIFESPDSLEALKDDSSFKSSSASLPSLPDCPPPELPTSPPPDLMDIAAEAEDGELLITRDLSSSPMDSEDAEKVRRQDQTSPSASSSGPLHQAASHAEAASKLHSFQSNYNEQRISAFDALVATEPDAEERKEPKLSVLDRRSLTLKAARRPDADTQPVLKRWSVQMNEYTDTKLPSDLKTALPTKPDSHDKDEETADVIPASAPSNSASPPSSDPSSEVLQSLASEAPKKTSPRKYGKSTSPIRDRSSSETRDTHQTKKHSAAFRQSLPPSSDILQKVKVISEGAVMHSPDIKYTRVAKKRWRKQQLDLDGLSGSASTGDVISSPDFELVPETASLRSFGSSSESPTPQLSRQTSALSPLVVSQMKQNQLKQETSEDSVKQLDGSSATIVEQNREDIKRRKPGLLHSVPSDISPIQSPDAQSPNSSKEDFLKENVLKEEVALPGDALIKAEGGTVQRKRKIRSVNSMITEASIHRKVLEQQLQGPVSDELASLGRLQHEQDQLLDQQLAQIREQQKMTFDLLGGSQTPRDSPRAFHPLTMHLDRDSLESDPERWSVEEVCQWLELVGLGMYRQAFRERNVNGSDLLHMDVQLFVDLGIDSPEIRELFLARIYELSNPAADEEEMEDDFLLPVDSYTPNDWKKLQAAVNALKSPLLDETIELEPSAIGQFLFNDHVRSQSTPNIAELDMGGDIDLGPEGPREHSGIVPSSTIHCFPNYALIGASADHTPRRQTPLTTTTMVASNGTYMSGMTEQIETRMRSFTDPSVFRISSTGEEEREERGKSPLVVSELDKGQAEDGKVRSKKAGKLEPVEEQSGVSKSDASVLQLAKDLSEGSITFEGGQFKTMKQGDNSLVAMTPEFWEQPLTGQETGIIRLYMSTVQKGTLYKAFLVTSSTTAKQLIRQALDKANMVEDPHNYCIWQAAVIPNASSRALLPQECPLTLQTQWPSYNSYRFELRIHENVRQLKIVVQLPGRKREELSVAIATITTCPEVIQLLLLRLHLTEEWGGERALCAMVEADPATKAQRVLGDEEQPAVVQSSWTEPRKLKLVSLSHTLMGQNLTKTDSERSPSQQVLGPELGPDSSTLVAHIQTLVQENTLLRQQLDSMQLHLQQYQELEHKMTSLHNANLSLSKELKQQQEGYQSRVHTLQQKVDELTLGNRKLEDQLHVSTSAGVGGPDQSDLLDQIQAKYSQEMSNLTRELRAKEKSLQELRTKRSALEEELSVLQGKGKELEQLSRLMGERNQQIRAFERDLATKEDIIHRLRDQLEEMQVTSDQVAALQKSLKAVEMTSQQQEDFAGRTIHELQEEVNHLTRETFRQEQLLNSLWKERERATRDQEVKDTLISTLESNLERYKVLGSLTAEEGTKVQVLEQSLSSHERALESLKAEHQRKQNELREAEEEVKKLRTAVAKKDEQLSQFSSILQGAERPSLHSLVAYWHPQLLIAAQVDPSDQGLGLKVTNAPEVGGCVIKEVADFCSATQQLKPGDRLLEINGSDVSSKSRQEVGGFLQQCYGAVQLVVGRPLPPSGALGAAESPSGMVIERFKKLNASLRTQLDSRSAEVDQWRQESERLKAEILRYSTAQKDKDSELKYLYSTIQDLKQQLGESEHSRAQLRHTLEEVESSRQDEHHSEALEAALQERVGEITALRASEKQKLGQLRKLQIERDGAVRALRHHLVSSDTSELPEEEIELQSEVLVHATQPEVLSSLRDTEEELRRHKTYLDQLLSIIIESSPDLLTRMGEAQRTRDQQETDNWC